LNGPLITTNCEREREREREGRRGREGGRWREKKR